VPKTEEEKASSKVSRRTISERAKLIFSAKT
jgi:hypothetical protein